MSKVLKVKLGDPQGSYFEEAVGKIHSGSKPFEVQRNAKNSAAVGIGRLVIVTEETEKEDAAAKALKEKEAADAKALKEKEAADALKLKEDNEAKAKELDKKLAPLEAAVKKEKNPTKKNELVTEYDKIKAEIAILRK